MPLPVQSLSAATEADLLALVAGGAREGTTLEFKRDAYGGSDDARAEFLADISAFANTAGGDLVIGMDEVDGAADALVGLATGTDPDVEIGRLQQMAQAGLQPRVTTIEMHAVRLATGRHALVVRVGRSYLAPHRVVFKNRNRFWIRGPAGRFEPDVDGLRALFNAAPAAAERIRAFRAERLGAIMAEETPVPLQAEPGRLILHLVPFSAVDGVSPPFDLSRMTDDVMPLHFDGGGSLDYRMNLDGFVAFRPLQVDGSRAYCQLFRNGAAEVVITGMVQAGSKTPLMSADRLAAHIAHRVRSLVPLLRRRGGQSPCAVLASICGVKAAQLAIENATWNGYDTPLPFERDIVAFQDLIVPERAGPANMREALRPLLQQLAEGAGTPDVPDLWLSWAAVRPS